MFKEKTRKLFTAIRFLNDFAVVFASFVIGYALKFKFFLHFSDIQYYPGAQVEPYLQALWYISPIWIFSFVLNGLYQEYKGSLAWMNEISSIVKGIALAMIQTMALTYVVKGLPQSRYVIVYAGMVAVVLLVISRGLINSVKNFLHRKHLGNQRALVIGSNKIGQEIAEKMILYPELGFNYIGTLCHSKPKKLNYHLKDLFKKLGIPGQYQKIIKGHDAQALFIAVDDISHEELIEIVNYCRQNNIYLRFTPSKYSFTTGSLN